ncbi:unnamed protein product [Ciceribacter sp. T2.26MG-112.2]|nr:unnamed protein product [Ciceribacter naphthalenivorans]SSX47327.1 unnamed protein product [Ciceribacter naphthalenivorans]
MGDGHSNSFPVANEINRFVGSGRPRQGQKAERRVSDV